MLQQYIDDVIELAAQSSPILVIAVVLITVTVFGALFGYVITPLLGRLVSRTDTNLDDVVFNHLPRPIFVTVVSVGLYIASIPLELTETRSLLISGLVTFLAAVWVWNLLKVVRGLTKTARSARDDQVGFLPIARNIATALIISIGSLVVLSVWDINIAPLLASAGVLGIVIGFAAKDTVANFFGAIALYFDNTYRVGDFITLEDGTEGTVEKISIRSTVIKTRDDVYVTVPNSILNSARVENQSAPDTTRRLVLPVSFAYGSDADAIERTLLQAADEHEEILKAPEPRVRFRGFGDNGLQYELLVWIPDPEPLPRLQHEVNEKIYRACNDEDIVFPFPQRTLHFANDGEAVQSPSEESRS